MYKIKKITIKTESYKRSIQLKIKKNMDEIQRLREQRHYRLYTICQRILSCIKSKIKIAVSSGISSIVYTFHTINMFGCPKLPKKRSDKIQKYVIEQLRQQGFNVFPDDSSVNDGDEWTIRISWKNDKSTII